MKAPLLKILSSFFALILTVATTGSVYADTFSFDEVKFVRENSDRTYPQKWSQLIFVVTGPRISGRVYRPSISFTLDTSLKNAKRTDIRFREDWLAKRWYQATSNTEMYLGSRPFNAAEKRELDLLSSDEKVVLAWIITNASELIDYALVTGPINKIHPRAQWQRMNQNEVFEKNLRNYFREIPGIAREIKARDTYAGHTKLLLKNRIQPALKKLGHYKGAIDGIIGPGTRRAIKGFERSQGIFPDGILRTKAEYNLLTSAIEGNKGDLSDYYTPLKSVLYRNLDEVAKKIKLRNISYGKFPNENDNQITDIVLEASFEWDGITDEFKLNGYYRNNIKRYFPNEFCVVPHYRSQPKVCMTRKSAGSVKKIISDYLGSANDSVVERTYLKCAIVRYRYDELYEQIKTNDITKLRSTEFTKRLFEKHRSSYIETAINCMNAIFNQEGSQSQVVRQAINAVTGPQDAKVLELREKLEVSEKRLESLTKLAETRLDLLLNSKTELEKLEKKQDKLELALENAESRTSTLNAKLLEVNKKLHIEEQIVRKLQNKISDQKETNSEEQLKITEEVLISSQQQISSLQNEVDRLTSELASERKKYEVRIDDEARKRLEVEGTEVEIKKNLRIAEQKLLSSKEKISSLEGAVAILTSDLESDSESYEQKIGDLENKISTLTQELETAEKQITATPEKPKGFVLSEEWQQYKQWITPSQMRFCNILHEYEIAREEAANSGNQLLQNMAIKQRDKDISALLTSSRTGQSGEGFRNWVSIVQSVFAMDSINPDTGKTELAAGVILDTPCGISVGTGRVLDAADAAKSEFKYLAFEGDLIFSQLASVRRGDPVLFDGSFARSEVGSSEMFITNELGEEQRLDAYEKPVDAPDMFVDITYLAKL
jgi:peptidoglycan hydrolase-like protein with peptidoglycan-binding domain